MVSLIATMTLLKLADAVTPITRMVVMKPIKITAGRLMIEPVVVKAFKLCIAMGAPLNMAGIGMPICDMKSLK